MNKVMVFSGGLDSTILLYKLVNDYGTENVNDLTFDYGQRNDYELTLAKRTCKILGVEQKVVDLSFLGELVSPVSCLIKDSAIDTPTDLEVIAKNKVPTTYVPYRNAIMASIAFSYAEVIEANEIYFALLRCDKFSPWDCSDQFRRAMNTVSKANRTKDIVFLAPFINKTKAAAIIIGKTLRVPFEDTWTCYKNPVLGKACKKCEACVQRVKYFSQADITDTIQYVTGDK